MKILIAMDLSENARQLLDQAIGLLQKALGTVWLLYVAEPEPDFVGYEVDSEVMRRQIAEEFHEKHRRLQALAEDLRANGIDARALSIQGDIVGTVVGQAGKLNVDMIVVGSRKHGVLYHFLLGDVSRGILKEAGRPVLVIPIEGG